jgi:short-subunit dehydrogenase
MQLGVFHEEDDATAIRQVDINLHGVITGTKLALRRMLPRNRGHIINVASSAGKGGVPGGATYSATKFAVVGLSEAVRGELRNLKADIDLSVVMPVVVRTELTAGVKATRGVKVLVPEDVAEAIVETLKVPRFEVFVPKSVGAINRTMHLLPRRAAEGIGRAIKADKVLFEIDENARRGYELRASASEPGLEAGDAQAQLPAGEQVGSER